MCVFIIYALNGFSFLASSINLSICFSWTTSFSYPTTINQTIMHPLYKRNKSLHSVVISPLRNLSARIINQLEKHLLYLTIRKTVSIQTSYWNTCHIWAWVQCILGQLKPFNLVKLILRSQVHDYSINAPFWVFCDG